MIKAQPGHHPFLTVVVQLSVERLDRLRELLLRTDPAVGRVSAAVYIDSAAFSLPATDAWVLEVVPCLGFQDRCPLPFRQSWLLPKHVRASSPHAPNFVLFLLCPSALQDGRAEGRGGEAIVPASSTVQPLGPTCGVSRVDKPGARTIFFAALDLNTLLPHQRVTQRGLELCHDQVGAGVV